MQIDIDFHKIHMQNRRSRKTTTTGNFIAKILPDMAFLYLHRKGQARGIRRALILSEEAAGSSSRPSVLLHSHFSVVFSAVNKSLARSPQEFFSFSPSFSILIDF